MNNHHYMAIPAYPEEWTKLTDDQARVRALKNGEQILLKLVSPNPKECLPLHRNRCVSLSEIRTHDKAATVTIQTCRMPLRVFSIHPSDRIDHFPKK